ncbi:MAG: response regulator transcription factor [Planctomycetota bacterium]|nr:response regulator transcription factor [Planctomycetota bacterium]
MNKEHIFIIEDETDIRDVVEYNLSREGYSVDSFSDGEAGLLAIQKQTPDLVLLDLMLPGLDGIEICRQLKQHHKTSSIPIIMITAKSEESDVVLGLGMGADDYVSKPFSPRELVARVGAVLRRPQPKGEGTNPDRIERHGLVIDSQRHEVLLEDKLISLTATEFKLLQFLASHPGRVFDRDHLLSRVLGEDVVVLERNIDVHVRSIRKKLDHPDDLIETVRGVGYRFKY